MDIVRPASIAKLGPQAGDAKQIPWLIKLDNINRIEKCLAHEQKSVRAICHKAEYREHRTMMLQNWTNMIDQWQMNLLSKPFMLPLLDDF